MKIQKLPTCFCSQSEWALTCEIFQWAEFYMNTGGRVGRVGLGYALLVVIVSVLRGHLRLALAECVHLADEPIVHGGTPTQNGYARGESKHLENLTHVIARQIVIMNVLSIMPMT